MKSRIMLLAAFILCLLMVTCREDNPSGPDPDTNPPDNPNLVTEEIGPDGGSISSSDNKMTLTIPEGALSATETITIEAIDEENLGDEFDEIAEEIGIKNAWELGPDGLEFDVPVTIQYQSEQTPTVSDDTLGIFMEFLFTSDEGTIEALDSLKTTFNTDNGSVRISGQTGHFTPIVNGFGGQENNGIQFFVMNIPDKAVVDDPFEVEAAITDNNTGPTGELVSVLGPSLYLDKSGTPIVPAFDGAPESEMETGNDFIRFFGIYSYNCSSAGLGVYGSELFTRVEFDLESGPVEAESYANFITTIECVEAMPEMFTLNLQKEGDGQGTVISDPGGIDCGVDCESDDGEFEEGVGAILAATAADGSEFQGWSGDVPETCENSTEPCTVIMDQNKSVTATFSPAEDGVPSINRFGGEITGPRSISFELRGEYDQEFSILDATINPDDGSGPQEVQLEETDIENEYQGYLDWEYGEGVMFPVMPEAIVTDSESGESNQENIELKKVTITVDKTGDGDGTITGTAFEGKVINCPPGCDTDNSDVIAVTFGGGYTTIALSAESDANSEFTGWSGDLQGSEGCEGKGDCTVFLNEDRTVTATFEKTTDQSCTEQPIEPGTQFPWGGSVREQDEEGSTNVRAEVTIEGAAEFVPGTEGADRGTWTTFTPTEGVLEIGTTSGGEVIEFSYDVKSTGAGTATWTFRAFDEGGQRGTVVCDFIFE